MKNNIVNNQYMKFLCIDSIPDAAPSGFRSLEFVSVKEI
ncbi:hypothetical protein SXCC_03559 [Gluconacetobacter sp. SXCC-1]|nr:hypothetical protein SXCC_03559 [Gluconacetobacter sp. SXCC-1]